MNTDELMSSLAKTNKPQEADMINSICSARGSPKSETLAWKGPNSAFSEPGDTSMERGKKPIRTVNGAVNKVCLGFRPWVLASATPPYCRLRLPALAASPLSSSGCWRFPHANLRLASPIPTANFSWDASKWKMSFCLICPTLTRIKKLTKKKSKIEKTS